mmetsp:Transcript_26317/g.56766  ORF Transcript_26317/g.56766 Transcript_26317/m.56766 type:complete len:299 (+) Transcript_26317:68-964(+)
MPQVQTMALHLRLPVSMIHNEEGRRIRPLAFPPNSFDCNSFRNDLCSSCDDDRIIKEKEGNGGINTDSSICIDDQGEKDDPRDPSSSGHDDVTVWQDHRGADGTHASQINPIRPNDDITLIDKDGSADTSIWHTSASVQFWKPIVVKTKLPQSCSNDSATSEHSTYIPRLDLGGAGTAQDMIIMESCDSIALRMINSLRIHDFAFILRSDGRWTYAIIADKQNDTIRFVVDADGCTKTLSKKHWSNSIRLVNPYEVFSTSTKSSRSKKSKRASKMKSPKQKEKEERMLQNCQRMQRST